MGRTSFANLTVSYPTPETLANKYTEQLYVMAPICQYDNNRVEKKIDNNLNVFNSSFLFLNPHIFFQRKDISNLDSLHTFLRPLIFDSALEFY